MVPMVFLWFSCGFHMVFNQTKSEISWRTSPGEIPMDHGQGASNYGARLRLPRPDTRRGGLGGSLVEMVSQGATRSFPNHVVVDGG